VPNKRQPIQSHRIGSKTVTQDDQSQDGLPQLPEVKEELVQHLDTADEPIGNWIEPKLEDSDELPTLLDLAAEQRREVGLQAAMEVDFELTDPNRKDEFRALIKEMGLGWEKVDRRSTRIYSEDPRLKRRSLLVREQGDRVAVAEHENSPPVWGRRLAEDVLVPIPPRHPRALPAGHQPGLDLRDSVRWLSSIKVKFDLKSQDRMKPRSYAPILISQHGFISLPHKSHSTETATANKLHACNA